MDRIIRTKVSANFRSFRPVADFVGSVETLLKHVPPEFLAGLDRVVLADRDAITPQERAKKRDWGRVTIGTYHRAKGKKPAFIELYMDRITRTWPLFS
jgi:hypothetical protein